MADLKQCILEVEIYGRYWGDMGEILTPNPKQCIHEVEHYL